MTAPASTAVPRVLDLATRSRDLTALEKIAGFRRAFANWPRVALDHLRITSRDYVCRLRNGGSFEVRGGTDDRHVLFEVFVREIYSTPLPPNAIVVDVGANIGAFTIWAALQGARVFSFEPFPTNFALLQRNVARSGVRADLFPMAVSSHAESRELFLPDNEEYVGRFSLHPGRGARTIRVECTSLDDVVGRNKLPRVDLLKLDCQGSEYEILFGASEDTLRRIRSIIVECEIFPDRTDWSPIAMSAFLTKHDFTTAIRGHMVYGQRRS
jgi:FkbM family methyltransferase